MSGPCAPARLIGTAARPASHAGVRRRSGRPSRQAGRGRAV